MSNDLWRIWDFVTRNVCCTYQELRIINNNHNDLKLALYILQRYKLISNMVILDEFDKYKTIIYYPIPG